MIPRGLTLMLERELRRSNRGGVKRLLGRCATILLYGVLLFGSQGFGPGVPFTVLLVALVFVLLIRQPVRAAGMLVQGRVEGTLPLLGVTPLRPVNLLAGIVTAALALAGEEVLIALPAIALAAAYGGLSTLELVMGGSTVLVAAVLGTALGAVVGARVDQHGTSAFLRVLSWMLALLLAPLVLSGAGVLLGWDWLEAATVLVLPGAIGTPYAQAIATLIINLLGSAAMFALAARRLRRTVLAQPVSSEVGASKRPPVPARGVVAWRERHRTAAKGWLRPGVIVVALILLGFGAVIATLLSAGMPLDNVLSMLVFLGTLLWLLLISWGLLTGARAYVEDREDGTLVLLLTSTLPRRRIAREKHWGALARARLGVLGGATLHTVSVVFLALEKGVDLFPAATGTLGVLLFWVGGAILGVSIGQRMSLLAPSTARAQAWASVAVALVFVGGSLVACIATGVIVSELRSDPWALTAWGGVGLFALIMGLVAQASTRHSLEDSRSGGLLTD